MVTRLTLDNMPDLYGTFEQFRHLFLTERPRPGSPTHAVLYNLMHEGQVVVALSGYGYALVHTGVWQERPVLFLDEIFIHPQARKQGRLKELVEWIQGYCIFNGIATVLATTFGVEEARPLQAHLGASSVSMLMQITIPYDAPLYRSTYRPPVMAPPQGVPVQAPAPRKRVRKKKARAEAPQFLEQEPGVVIDEPEPGDAFMQRVVETHSQGLQQVLAQEANESLPPHLVRRDGWTLPRHVERM